ncbi:MAG TPA: glycosyltransferase family 87 protein [Pseudonocardiaceae bacterium]|jgi:alpha-1,2-mannosyltransferase/arabinofuranan 3-O-arabinosyltransferase|nr:glycosyltransferase family 87 protein [Pseudonocardiaceae bacterium]
MAGYLWVRYGSANLYRVEGDAMALHVDFETFHRSAVALLHGQNLYVTGALVPNLDPPFWSVLVAPFGLLDPLPAYRLFALFTLALLLGCYAMVVRELRLPAAPAGLALCAVFASSPLLSTIALGQAYGVLLTGLVGCWFADRRGRPLVAGVLLGLVIAAKPTLAPLLLFPVARRQWPMLWATVAGAAGGTLIGVVVPGVAQTRQWLRIMTETSISSGGDNASLPALLLRLGGPAWIGFGLGVIVVAVTGWRIWRGGYSPLALWALTAATLLLSPVAWNNYLVLCFPGVLVLLGRRRRALAAFLLALTVIGVEWAGLWHGTGVVTRLGHSLYCFVLLAYWLAMLVFLPSRPTVAVTTVPAQLPELADQVS